MKPLHAGWLIDVYNQLSLFEGEQIILSGWKAAGISVALEKGLAGFSGGIMDPFDDIDPFNQEEIDFNMSSVVSVASEEYVEIERIVNVHDDDDNNGEYLLNTAIPDEMDNEEDEH